MTSTNDGKDVKSNLTSRPKDKTYYIELYKSLEARLSGEDSLPARTGHVCDAWRRVYCLHQHSSPSTHPHLLSWLQRHTARTVLQTEWVKRPDEQSKLGAAIDALTAEAEAAAAGRERHAWEDQLLQRARWFRSVLPDPWGHPVLKSLLAKETVTDEQVLEWLTEERGLVFVTRLRALAASKCVDLALALAAAVMDRARAARLLPKDDVATDQPEPEEDTSSFYSALRRDAGFLDVWDLLTDIEFVLLDKQDKRERCIELAKQTPLRDGYQLVERLRNRLETLPREKKLWKNAKEVATLIAQVVIARCMVVPTCTGSSRTALYCCARSLARLVPAPRLPAVTAALAAPAATARHLHTLCAAIHAQCEGKMKPFVCELYVRAITAGMNELERLKLNTEKQAEARASEQTLASWFTQLGTLLSASPRLLAECALTAFSVHPALQMFERVRRAPPPHNTVPDAQEPAPDTSSDFGSWANDSRTQSNLVKTSKTLQLKHTQGQANVISTAIFTEAEGLGLGPELCQDLAVLLAGPRVKTLSWDMERELLLENCNLYMERTHGGTRALTTELKYLNLDPRAFQHLPEEDDFENDGIEKGYEQQLSPLKEPQEIWQNAFFDPEHTESAEDSEVALLTAARRRGPRSSDDEDPLSLIADAKKERRQHARDKTKHRKKTHKRATSKEGSKDRRKEKDITKEKDKKTKRERKKKSELPTGSLDSLLGMKVTNMPAKVQDGEKRVRKKVRRRNYNLANVTVTTSDDGQGRLAQFSDNNDPSVVIDGQFSMDELKSPERRNSLDTQKSVDLSPAVSNNVTNVPKPTVEAAIQAKTSKGRSTASDDSDASRSKSPYLTPNQLTNRHIVSNKVKTSISKLLQFRRTKPKLPKNPFPNAHLNERVNSPLPNHSLVGKKVHTSEDTPKVYMNKKQTQHFEAMKSEVNNLLNAAIVANRAGMSKIPYNEPTFDFNPKVTSPQKVYNAHRLQDVRYPHYSNSMPNLVQNSNMLSENQKAYSNYIQSSPQKPSSYSPMTSQPPRTFSVIDSSYVSPPKQAEKLYSIKTTPPKSAANTLMHQTYYKSMQNLTQSDNVKFDQSQKQSISDPKYYDQYSKSNSQTYSANPNNTSLKATNQTQSQPHYNYNPVQRQKAREDLMKLYQTLPNTNLNGIHPSSSLQMNTQANPSFKRDVANSQSPMKSSMQTILNETLRTVSIDIAKELSNIQIPNVSQPGHTSPAKSYGPSSHSEASKVPQSHYVHDNKPQPQQRVTKRATPEKPSNIVKDTTVKQHIVQANRNVQAEQPASKVSQSSFQEFLQDLQNSINAGVIEAGKPIALNKDVKITPVNQPSTSTPAKKSDLTVSAKQLIQQKKTETAPPTFSRLNYMHKNKQIDINAKLNKNIMDHKISKAKHMKSEVMVSRADKRHPTKASTPGNNSKDCPVLARMLDASPLPMTKGTCQAPWASGKDMLSTSSPNVSQNTASGSTASREHADLLLLLRNQATLKSTTDNLKLPSTSERTQVPATHQRTNEEKNATPVVGAKLKNADTFAVPKPQGKRVCTKSNDKEQQDWESVLNALRAHSTPPLGPNALDMVLNKDKKHSQTYSRPHTSQKPTSSASKSLQNKPGNTRKRANSSSRSSSSTSKPSIEKNVEAPKKQNQIEFIKKALQPEVPKRTEVRNKHFTSNPIKDDDPFISGISNSDYDLLEELMDDDLRQEMWSSDEESYPTRAVISAKNKGSNNNPKNNPNVCTKVANVLNEKQQVIDSKTSVCKTAPHLSSLASNSTRTAVKSCPETGYLNVIANPPTIPEATSVTESRPSLCTNINNQHTTTNIIMNQNDVMVTQTEPTHYIANIAGNNNMEPSNVIITSIPAQPMVLISQEIVYDNYRTIRFQETQVSAGLCNVSQNTFVALNAMPNIAVYQTTQFAAPVINPVIIGNATTTTTNVKKALEHHQGNNDYVKQEVTPAVKLEIEKPVKIQTNPENSEPVNTNSTTVHKMKTNPKNSQTVNTNTTAVHKMETNSENSQPLNANSPAVHKVETNPENSKPVNTTLTAVHKIKINPENSQPVNTYLTAVHKIETNRENGQPVNNNLTAIHKMESNPEISQLVNSNLTAVHEMETHPETRQPVNTNLTAVHKIETNPENSQAVNHNLTAVHKMETNPENSQPVNNNLTAVHKMETNPENCQLVNTNLTAVHEIEIHPENSQPVNTSLTAVYKMEINRENIQPVNTNLTAVNKMEINPEHSQLVNTNLTAVHKMETNPENSRPVNTNLTLVHKMETNTENSQPVITNLTAVHKIETNPENSQPVNTNPTDDRCGMNTDININKLCERKVLSQMQENNTYDNLEKDTRMRRLSVDSNPLKTKQDKERIKLKRESLLNRKIVHPCYHPPIPLTYTPLGRKKNTGKLLQQGTYKNGVVKFNLKQKSSIIVIKDAIPEDPNVESPKSETNNENIESTDQASSTKENQNVCRRILLRSSNKLQNKDTPCKSTKIAIRRRTTKQKPTAITEKVADKDNFKKTTIKVKLDSKTPTRISRRILNKAMVKVAMPIPDTTTVHQLHEKTTENSKSNAITDSALIDFENELSGSKILKISSSPENNADKDEQNLTECMHNDFTKPENPQNVESNKKVQVNIDKSVVNEHRKITTPNNSTMCSQEPTVLLDKLKNNFGNEIIKSSSVLTPSKKPIVMTIKNRNQAILTNGANTKDTKTSQQGCNKIVEREIAPENLKEHTLNKIIATEPSLHHMNKQKLDTTNLKHVTDILRTVQKTIDSDNLASKPTKKIDGNSNQPQTLPVKMTPVIVKESHLLLETQNTASIIPEKTPTSEQSEKLNAIIPTLTAQKATKADCDMLRNLEVNKPSIKNKARSTRSLFKIASTDNNICGNKELTSHETKKQVSQKMKTINRNKDPKEDSTNKKGNNESLKCHETIDQVAVTCGCQKAKPGRINNDEPKLKNEDVLIEEIPLKDNKDPDKKCVRVKLSNGKTFRATVYGKMHVDYDTLFAEPAMRNVLTDGLTDGRRYTLNIKQVSKAERGNPNKILDRQIQELNIKEMQVPIDTVNLISDDEDDDIRSVSTEFGIFTLNIDSETIRKHQKKFTQRCVVKLNRDNILKGPSISNSLINRNKSKSISIEHNNTIIPPQANTTPVNVEDWSAVKLNSATQTTEDVPEIIEIDDSSNDSLYRSQESTNQESVSKIIEFKSLLLEELGVDCNNTTDISSNNQTPHPDKVPAVESLTNALLEDLSVEITTKILDDKVIKKKQVKADDPIMTQGAPIRHCVVKITKCDDLVKKYDIVNNMKKCCVVLKRCDDVNTTNHVQSNDIADDQESEELNIECSEDFIYFDVEDTEDSQQLSRCPSASILDNLWDDTCQPTVENVYGRSSPVMDVFEALVSLSNKSKQSFNLVEKVENPALPCWPCESEWTMTKHAFSVEENMYMTEAKEKTTTSLTINGLYVRNPVSYKASKLVAIVLKYLEENPIIIHRLQPTRKVQKRALIKRPLNKVKRIISDQSVDNNYVKTVHKLGTLALNAINTNSGNFTTAKKKEISIVTDVTLNQKEGEHCNCPKIQTEPDLGVGDIIAQETIDCLNIPKDKTGKMGKEVNREVKIYEVKVVPQQEHTEETNTLSQIEVVEMQNKCAFDDDVPDVTMSEYCEENIITRANVKEIEPECVLDAKSLKAENAVSNVTSSINNDVKENSNVSVDGEISIDNMEKDQHLVQIYKCAENDSTTNHVVEIGTVEPEKVTFEVKASDVESQDVDYDQCDKNDVEHDIVPNNCDNSCKLTTDVSLDTSEIRDHSDKLASSDSQHLNINVESAEESVDAKETDNLALDKIGKNEPGELARPFYSMIKTVFEDLQLAVSENHLDQVETNQDDAVNTGLVDEIPNEKYEIETIETDIEKLAYVTQNSIEHRVSEQAAEKLETPLENVTHEFEPEEIGKSLSPAPCINSFKTDIVSLPAVLTSFTRESDLVLDPKEPETSCYNKNFDPLEDPFTEIPDKHNAVEDTSFKESAFATQNIKELSSPEHVANKIEVECIDKNEPSKTETSVLSTLRNFTQIADLVQRAVTDDHCIFDDDLPAYKVKTTDANVEETIKITPNMRELSLSPEHITDITETPLEIYNKSSDKNEHNKIAQLAALSPLDNLTKKESVEPTVLDDHQNRDNIDNANVHENPIEEILDATYEVEIIDTSIEESTGVAQNIRELCSPELDTEKTEESLEVESEDTQTISPLFFDNKEIMFNYHDYTKLPKIKEHTIQSEESNSRSPNHVSLDDKDKFEAANVKRKEHYLSENNSSSPAIFHDCQMKSNPDYKYELIQEDDWLTVITTENDKEHSNDVETEELKFEHVVEDPESPSTFSSEDRGVTLKGIEYKDPYIGTCYVFALNESGSSASNISSDSLEVSQESCDVIESFNRSENADLYNDLHNIEFCVIAPNVTYSRKTLKRKMDMRDADVVDKKYRKGKSGDQTVKIVEKRYRKGKNIDCPKQTVTSMTETAYGKEYKHLLEYCSAVKFSYSRPFHKEIIEVDLMATDRPINDTYNYTTEDSVDENLFVDVQDTPIYQPDPASQTLAEEIAYDYEKAGPLEGNLSDEACETNFNMGFGERSGRVIQNLKKKRVSNISAATLSDVKQTQPFLVSEDYDEYAVLNTNKDDQIKKIRQYVNFIELRDKVRSFFTKTSIELKSDWMKQHAKECDRSVTADFPYDLCSLDYIQPSPTETIVQVVQLGQLPVSAAAQNPMSCDPRVTQVSDASPPQCSVDNSPNDDSQSEIKAEYTELTTADLTLPLVQEYAQQNHAMQQNLEPHGINNLEITEQTVCLEMEIKAEEKPEIKEELPEIKEEGSNSFDNADLNTLTYAKPENVDYLYENNTAKSDSSSTVYDSSEQNSSETFTQKRQQNGASEKTDQIAHAMNAAGITTSPESTTNSRAHAFVCSLSQNIRQGSVNTTQTTANTYSKTTSINAMALQQALAQILPPPLNQTNNGDNSQTSTPVGPQVLHIVQGKNSSGNQITLVDNSQQSVISTPSGTQVLHIVQNKGAAAGQTSNGTLGQQPNSFGGLSLVDTGLQQGGNQLLHIVNTGNQKNASPGQLLKRVNLLTNLTNVQGSNEQKMVQFVCKSADGKAIQLNAPHQRSMVLRLQPIETSNVQTPPAKSAEPPELSTSPTILASNKESASQQEIKSRSIYEENYAKFIQNSSSKTPNPEKSTSLPKFNQAFGKPVFQEGTQKQGDTPNNNSHLSPATTNSDNAECPSDNAMNLEHIRQIGSPPMLIRKSTTVTTQSPSNLVQQIKQSIAPMNIQTMHGGVIYTRQIPVNIGGGQTINLITVPSTELINNEETSKPQAANQNEGEPSIIKIVPQNQNLTNTDSSQEENNSHMSSSNETAPTPQPQPVLTQMRIKLPMLSKAPQMVPGARVVRPSFFQIQRNVIGGANQPVYQQLVLTAASPLGQQTIRLPQAHTARPIKVPSESQSSSSESMSSSTLEQLREFDMVLEQVKERSTVQPAGNTNTGSFKIHTISSDTLDGTGSSNCSNESSSTQVLYSIGNNQSVNVAYVNRKAMVTTPTTSTYVRSPDSSGIADSPTSSTHVQMPHTSASDSSPTEMTSQPKPAKVGSKSKSRNKASSNPPNTLKLNTVPPKTSSQKPLEDEQTTQRILYILAEYKEQVENSPDKDKPAPRRRSNPPSNPGSSKRKKSSSSRRSGTHDMSPVHGEDTCRTMGSEDSSCGTSQGDCNESCLDSHSPQDSPRKVARKITFDQDPPLTQTRPQPHRNVIVADGQTITVARGSTGKPTTAVLMPANYILPVSMVKGGQQIAIVTNRGPKLLTVGGEAGTASALLLQRLIGPGGLKPVLARPGVRQVRLPTAALHNLQAFNLATATAVQNPDSTASPSPGPTPPELVDSRATSSPWTDRDDVKPERDSSPEGSEPWNLPSSADGHEYTYEETVRTDNMDRTVLDAIPDRYSPDMEAQRIFDKMFDVDSKKSYAVDSPRCAYDIDASDCDDKAYQVVQKKDGSQRQHRLTHVSAAALRHKYAILEHELRLQKSLSEECEDLGVDSPSASELFPEAELLFAASPAHEHNQDAHHPHTPQPIQSTIPQPDLDDQIATDHLIPREVDMGLDVGIVTVGPDGQATIALDQEEFARSHPNTTFHSEPTDGEVQPFTITGLKGRHITSTIFHSNSAPATVLMAAPQPTVISQASDHGVKYEIENMINNMPSSHNNDMNLSSVLVKDDGLTRFDSILTDSRELHLSNTASAIVHSSGNATQVIRRVCYEDEKRNRDNTFLLIDEPENVIAGDDAKMVAEDSRDATLISMAGVDDDRSSPERHAELFWESNSASERSETRRPLDFSSDSDKCCKSPSFDETNSTDSSGVGAHMRLDSVIKEARRRERSGSVEGSSADDAQPPLRTYPAKRLFHAGRSLSGKTRAGERSPGSPDPRRRASARGVVKRGCPCCSGAPQPPPARKRPRQRKPALDFAANH